MGENGAGKSTLMKILGGLQPADAGKIILHGKEVSFANPHDSLNNKIAMIHQELTSIPHMTVAENIYLGREPLAKKVFVSDKEQNERTEKLLTELEIQLTQNENGQSSRSLRCS